MHSLRIAISLLVIMFLFSIYSVNAIEMRTLSSNNVSIIALISNPEQYDDLHVVFYGCIDMEIHAAMVSEWDIIHGITKNGIYLKPPNFIDGIENMGIEYPYCRIEGIFSADNLGPDGAFSGTLEVVQGISCND